MFLLSLESQSFLASTRYQFWSASGILFLPYPSYVVSFRLTASWRGGARWETSSSTRVEKINRLRTTYYRLGLRTDKTKTRMDAEIRNLDWILNDIKNMRVTGWREQMQDRKKWAEIKSRDGKRITTWMHEDNNRLIYQKRCARNWGYFGTYTTRRPALFIY